MTSSHDEKRPDVVFLAAEGTQAQQLIDQLTDEKEKDYQIATRDKTRLIQKKYDENDKETHNALLNATTLIVALDTSFPLEQQIAFLKSFFELLNIGHPDQNCVFVSYLPERNQLDDTKAIEQHSSWQYSSDYERVIIDLWGNLSQKVSESTRDNETGTRNTMYQPKPISIYKVKEEIGRLTEMRSQRDKSRAEEAEKYAKHSLIEAFKTIYTALREGQSAWIYKTNFLRTLADEKDKDPAKLIEKIKQHAKDNPKSRTAEAIRLAELHFNDVKTTNRELFNDIYKWSFANSGWIFKRSQRIPGTTFFRSATLNETLRIEANLRNDGRWPDAKEKPGLGSIEYTDHIPKDPKKDSRSDKILNALSKHAKRP